MAVIERSEMKTIKARVRDGAAYLDEVHPGWEDEIDLDSLNLQEACSCVLGQLVANVNWSCSYYDVAADIATDVNYKEHDIAQKLGFPHFLTHREAAAKGFHLARSIVGSNRQWQRLTDEWKRVITERRAER